VRRLTFALFFALLCVVSLTAPASAVGETDIVVGRPDGSFEVRSVPTPTVATAIARAEREPGVAWAEVDVPLRAAASVTPNDPSFPDQWAPRRVRAPEAWARSTGDTSVVVAVVDSGVDATHPDLAGNVLEGADFVGDGAVGDPEGHGTGVAGVIAAKGNNGVGVAGYCWTCKILPVRSLDAKGNGSSSTVASGIRWAADHGADIINLSLAGSSTNQTLESAIAYAISRGVLVVAAAGNQTRSGQNLTVPQYPAASDGVLGVVATTDSDVAYSWTFNGPWADVTAPGCVTSTAPNGGYKAACGTSFASPAVAGVLALALAAFPKAPPSAVQSALLSTTVPLTSALAAKGRIDAAALLDQLAPLFPNVVTPERVAGADRIATAVALSKRAFLAADTVVVARADSYADALAASPLAGRFHAPVLLTGSSALAPNVAEEVRRLGATTAWLIGGTGALSPAVEAGLQAAGVASLPRLAGTSRYDTARLIAMQLGAVSAYVVEATGWPDAVAVSGLAALTKTPILLVDRNGVPAATSQAIAALHPTTITVVGGTGVVSDAVVNTLRATGATVNRLFGASRYQTSAVIAGVAATSGADAHRTWVATGADWPDALAAGPAAAATGAVLLLVDGRSVATPTVATWLKAVVGGVRELVVVGGPASVGDPAFAALAAVLS
jgi:putative cell wall-binding protein